MCNLRMCLRKCPESTHWALSITHTHRHTQTDTHTHTHTDTHTHTHTHTHRQTHTHTHTHTRTDTHLFVTNGDVGLNSPQVICLCSLSEYRGFFIGSRQHRRHLGVHLP